MMPRTDEQILTDVQSYLSTCEPAFASANLIDGAVLRFYGAVTHFSPGSFASRPFQETTLPNLFLAGDWVKGVPHGANGLSQERAYITGLIAANKVIERCMKGSPAAILDVQSDEPHIAALKTLNREIKDRIRGLGLDSVLLPW